MSYRGFTYYKNTGMYFSRLNGYFCMVLAARARAWPYIRKYSIPLEGAAVQPIELLYRCEGTLDWYFFFFFFFISLIADGPHHYHPACGHKGSSHLSPVHALQFFYRDASSALLQLVNQWLNFTYSRSHAFRYEGKNTNPTLIRSNSRLPYQQMCSLPTRPLG